jgi:hypothetical protein
MRRHDAAGRDVGTVRRKAGTQIDLDGAAKRLARNLPPKPWMPWPGGWPDQIELAVLDAVFSIRARYGKPAGDGKDATGVRRVLDNWRCHREGADLDDLQVLAAFKDRPKHLAKILVNDSETAGRLKASAASEVAHRFATEGEPRVRHASQFPGAGEDQQELRRRWMTTVGLGPVTWSYLCILLGQPDVKADVMITRYLQHALKLDRPPSSKEARTIVKLAAERLDLSATDLDHAIWSFERDRQRSGDSTIRLADSLKQLGGE